MEKLTQHVRFHKRTRSQKKWSRYSLDDSKAGAKFDTDGLWIPKGHSEGDLYWSREYINHALSKESQQIWLDGLGLPGVIPGLRPPPGLAGDPSIQLNRLTLI